MGRIQPTGGGPPRKRDGIARDFFYCARRYSLARDGAPPSCKLVLRKSTVLEMLRHIDDLSFEFWHQGVGHFTARLCEH
jgi:hypothetical protein